MLKFIGSGSCFNTDLGNNSAYIKEDNNFLLIDCGGDVFSKIIKNNLLDGVKNITVLITHMHSDHIGSLSDLIFYSYFILNKKLTVVFPCYDIIDLLEIMGVPKTFYYHDEFLNHPFDYNKKHTLIYGYLITLYETKHANNLDCYGYLFDNKQYKFYFSGDSRDIPKNIINKLENNQIDYIYQDVSGLDYEENIHLSFKQLCELIKPKFRNKIYCMHLDNSFDIENTRLLGFNVVKNEF